MGISLETHERYFVSDVVKYSVPTAIYCSSFSDKSNWIKVNVNAIL